MSRAGESVGWPWRALACVPDLVNQLAFAGIDRALRRLPGADTVFFEPSRFPWLVELQAEWRTIRSEVEPLLQELQRLPTVRDIEQTGDSPIDEWRAMFLRFGGERMDQHAARCPRTMALRQRSRRTSSQSPPARVNPRPDGGACS